MTKNIFATTELAGALLSEECRLNDELHKQTLKDIKQIIFAYTNCDVRNMDICVFENTDNECGLVLPYYSVLENSMAEELLDDDLNHIVAGEIIGGLAAFFGGVGAIFLGVGAFSLSTGSGFTLGAVALGVGVSSAVAAAYAVAGGTVAAGIGTGIAYGVKETNNK